MREGNPRRDRKICLTWACARICLNNSYLFELIRHFFEVNHYPLADNLEESDVVVVNTCGYTDRTAEENLNFVRSIRERYPDKEVIVFGCLTKISEPLGQDHGLTMIGPKEIERFSDLFDHTVACGDMATLSCAYPHRTPEMLGEINEAYLQISQGCSNFCSYCNIKIAKGAVVSKPVARVRKEAMYLIEQGVREITLLADDCGSYGHDIQSDIGLLAADLLGADGLLKLKLYTIFPGLFLKYYPALKGFFEDGRITYACLPLQSGSGRILRLMNREYDPGMVSAVVADIKRRNPETRLFTHFIVGFPGETIDDFRRSLDLASLFDCVLFLPYGANSRTAAAEILDASTRCETEVKLQIASEAIGGGYIRGLVVR